MQVPHGYADQVVLRHVFREQNQVADTLAKEGPKQGDFGNTKFFEQFKADYSGTYQVRKVRENILSSVSRDVTQLNFNMANYSGQNSVSTA